MCPLFPIRHLLLVAALGLLRVGMAEETGRFFATPGAPFLAAPDETVRVLDYGTGTAEELQELLDQARRESAEAVVVARVGGVVQVGKAPLRLGSRMALTFLAGGGMVAAADASAEALVSIRDADTVSLAGRGVDRAVLDGKGVVGTCVKVRDSDRVHLDRLHVKGSSGDGVLYLGRGDENRPIGKDWWKRKYAPEFAGKAGSVTRCRLEANGGTGARIAGVAQFPFVDNLVVRNGTAGVDVHSFNSVVAGCCFVENATGMVLRGTDGTVVRNALRANGVGVLVAEPADLNLLTHNRLSANRLGVELAGSRNSVYHNECEGGVPFRVTGRGNTLCANRDCAVEGGGTGTVSFRPPTVTDFHQGPVVAGMPRHDLTVEGGTGRGSLPFKAEEAVDLSVAQEALDTARQAHPEAVLVARLHGRFCATGKGTGLRLPDNTCVVLDGAIQACAEGVGEIVKMDGKGFASFSGGLVDGNFLAGEGILVTGGNTAVVDGVTVRHTLKNGINTKGHGRPGSPLFIRGCTVTNSRGRGIWMHVTADTHVIDNVSCGNASDGVDLDAFCFHSTALLNVCTANQRSGAFVEEGINSTVVFGNTFSRNRTGILVYNHSVDGNTGSNVMACNRIEENTQCGVSIRGMRFPNKTAHGNFVFGNAIVGNLAAGVRFGHPAARDNVVSQNLLRDNQTALDYITAGAVLGFFSSPQ